MIIPRRFTHDSPRAQTLTSVPPHLFLFCKLCHFCPFCFLSFNSFVTTHASHSLHCVLSASRFKTITFTNSSMQYCCHVTLSLDVFNAESIGELSVSCFVDNGRFGIYSGSKKEQNVKKLAHRSLQTRKLFITCSYKSCGCFFVTIYFSLFCAWLNVCTFLRIRFDVFKMT